MEHPELFALMSPRRRREGGCSSNQKEQLTALLATRVFIDGKLVSLWPDPAPQPAPAAARVVTPSQPAPPPEPVHDVSVAALQQKQTAYQGMIDRIVHELDADAHFVSYAPPVLIAFHGKSYLQLSATTKLAPSDLGSQYRIAALAFDRHVSHLIRPLVAILSKDIDFDGIVFSSTISAASQSVEFFLPVSDLRRYADHDLTGQQLINSGLVLINGERVGLELQSAEADIR